MKQIKISRRKSSSGLNRKWKKKKKKDCVYFKPSVKLGEKKIGKKYIVQLNEIVYKKKEKFIKSKVKKIINSENKKNLQKKILVKGTIVQNQNNDIVKITNKPSKNHILQGVFISETKN